jgi:protein gp37
MKTEGKKSIEYSDIAWNPFTGCLAEDCAVEQRKACWAKRMAQRQQGHNGYPEENPFQPTFHPDKLEQPLHWIKPRRIATCFMGDIAFATPNQRSVIYRVMRETPQHRYYILSKQIASLRDDTFPKNAWVGTTINCQRDMHRLLELLSLPVQEVYFLSLEPPYEDLVFPREAIYVKWLIIGAQTNPEFQPKQDWVQHILDFADSIGIPVFMKANLRFEPKRLEFPKLTVREVRQ